jgi:hypothetical protein
MNQQVPRTVSCIADSLSRRERPTECVAWLEDRGYEFKGGSTRRVFVTPDGGRVVKLEPRGRFNRREAELSRLGLDALVPVLDHGADHTWLVMPRVDVPAWGDIPQSAVREVRRSLREQGYECTDVRRGNVGFMDGRPALFDYAEGCDEVGDFSF